MSLQTKLGQTEGKDSLKLFEVQAMAACNGIQKTGEVNRTVSVTILLPNRFLVTTRLLMEGATKLSANPSQKINYQLL